MKTTQEGLDRLHENVREITRRHNEATEEARIALSDQGPEENEGYYHAKSRCHQLESQIVALQAEIRNAEIVDEVVFDGAVGFGTIVTALNLETDKESVYTILGEPDANAKRGILSYTSPIGSGLLGHRVGDVVDVDMPNGRTISFEILTVELSSYVKPKAPDTSSEV